MGNRLLQALGYGFEVTAGQAPVGGEALGEDEHAPARLGQVVVVAGQPAPDVGQGVLFGAHGHPVGQSRHVPHDVGHLAVTLALLALADEPGVLGEAAGVQEQRQTVPVAHLPYGPQVGQAYRLAAAGVVGHRHHDDGDVLGPDPAHERLQGIDVQVALKRVPAARVSSLGDHEVDGLGPGGLDVGPGGVEVGVVGHELARAADHAEEDLLRGPALVGGDDVAEGEKLGNRVAEQVPRR